MRIVASSAAATSMGLRRARDVIVFVVPGGLRVPLALTLGGVCAAACAISLVVGLTWDKDAILSPFLWTGVITGCMALAAGFGALRFHCGDCARITPAHANGSSRSCEGMYTRYQIGVGFALLLFGVISVFVFAGLVHRLQFDSLKPPQAETRVQRQADDGPATTPMTSAQVDDLARTCALRIILALNMAVLGALFFVANSLRKLRICHRPFDSMIFWGGLWYRIGEAILFTLVFLLLIHWKYHGDLSKTSPAYDLWLPLLALMLGMFIKTGERLVFGTAERIFAAAAAMIPVQPEVAEPATKLRAGSKLDDSPRRIGSKMDMDHGETGAMASPR